MRGGVCSCGGSKSGVDAAPMVGACVGASNGDPGVRGVRWKDESFRFVMPYDGFEGGAGEPVPVELSGEVVHEDWVPGRPLLEKESPAFADGLALGKGLHGLSHGFFGSRRLVAQYAGAQECGVESQNAETEEYDGEDVLLECECDDRRDGCEYDEKHGDPMHVIYMWYV